jgi:glycerol-3-phosphate acyltransferase PlsY
MAGRMIELGLKFTLAYLLGSVLGSLVIGRVRGVDVRAVGSGNPGGTNALRTQGKWFALGVMLIDVGKGLLAVLWLPGFAFPGVTQDPSLDPLALTHALALAAVLGHVFPVWHSFKGGKGGATAAGVLLALAPDLALLVLGAWLLVIGWTGYVGLATMGAAAGAAVFVGIMRLPEAQPLFVLACLVAALLVYTHRGNIKRMQEGRENRMGRFLRRR